MANLLQTCAATCLCSPVVCSTGVIRIGSAAGTTNTCPIAMKQTSVHQYLMIESTGTYEAMTHYYNPTAASWYTGIRNTDTTTAFHVYTSAGTGDALRIHTNKTLESLGIITAVTCVSSPIICATNYSQSPLIYGSGHGKKVILNTHSIVEEPGVHPTNMALARAIIGDASDNLPGIKGAGFATVKKRLDFLAEEKYYNIDEIIEYCDNVPSSLSFFKKVVEDKALIEKNYKMMQLYSPQLSVQGKDHVKYAVENFECEFNKTKIIGMMKNDGLGELNWEDLKEHLNKISRECVGNNNT